VQDGLIVGEGWNGDVVQGMVKGHLVAIKFAPQGSFRAEVSFLSFKIL
jgi:hypothetical protein